MYASFDTQRQIEALPGTRPRRRSKWTRSSIEKYASSVRRCAHSASTTQARQSTTSSVRERAGRAAGRADAATERERRALFGGVRSCARRARVFTPASLLDHDETDLAVESILSRWRAGRRQPRAAVEAKLDLVHTDLERQLDLPPIATDGRQRERRPARHVTHDLDPARMARHDHQRAEAVPVFLEMPAQRRRRLVHAADRLDDRTDRIGEAKSECRALSAARIEREQ